MKVDGAVVVWDDAEFGWIFDAVLGRVAAEVEHVCSEDQVFYRYIL